MRVAPYPILLFILSAGLMISSCQKEVGTLDPDTGTGTGNNNSITGDYDFVGLTASASSTVIVSSSGTELKAVTVSSYITKDNVGTAKITATDILLMGVGYSVDTTANAKTYADGVLLDDSDVPFIVTLPPTNTTSPYTVITKDSLSVMGALGVQDPSGITPTGPSGIKTSWSGDTLIFKMAATFTQDVSQSGTPGTLTAIINATSKFKKR